MADNIFSNKNIVGLIQFVLILDNEGKSLYSKYYIPSTMDLSKSSAQKDFEKKLCYTVINFNVNKSNEGTRWYITIY
jgi:hypothetical protein